MKVLSKKKKSSYSKFSVLLLTISGFSIGCSYDPSDESASSEPNLLVNESDAPTTDSAGTEKRLEERPIVLKKMKRLSSQAQSLAFTESSTQEALVCEAFDELREDVKCRLESVDGRILAADDYKWKLSMQDPVDPVAQLQEIGGEWHVNILGEGSWGLEVLGEDGMVVAKSDKDQSVCHTSLVEHVGLDGANRCLESASTSSSGLKGFSHLRLVNLQAESQQAVVESSGEDVLGKRGDRIALSIYTSGLPSDAKIGSYGLPILDESGREVMRVCMSASDLRMPGWLGAQLRLSGSANLKVGRPQVSMDASCRSQASKGFLVWYEAHIF